MKMGSYDLDDLHGPDLKVPAFSYLLTSGLPFCYSHIESAQRVTSLDQSLE
jgi:hypothetical protein